MAEWTEWRMHDGTCNPVPAGLLVQAKLERPAGEGRRIAAGGGEKFISADTVQFINDASFGGVFCCWSKTSYGIKIVRYRYKIPGGVQTLKKIAANVCKTGVPDHAV